MSKYLSVTPAYSRDYKSSKEVQAAWAEGKDFLWDGKPVNLEDARRAGYTHVKIRYEQLRKVCVIAIEQEVQP